MEITTKSRFGDEPRHIVRERVYDKLVVGREIEADDISGIRLQLGLHDLTDRQVNEAICALKWKHRLVSISRPRVGRVTRGWSVRRLSD